jgi:hypothetical protein
MPLLPKIEATKNAGDDEQSSIRLPFAKHARPVGRIR